MKELIGAIGIITIVFTSASAFAYSGQNLAPRANISIEQARNIALKVFPGKITDEELEYEHSGTGLRYSFDIQRGNIEQEVGIDAKTGKLLENRHEEKNPD